MRGGASRSKLVWNLRRGSSKSRWKMRSYRWKMGDAQVNLAVGRRKGGARGKWGIDHRWKNLSGWKDRMHWMSSSRWRIKVVVFLVRRWRGPIEHRVHCRPCAITESHPVQVFLHWCQLSLVLRAFAADIHNCVSLALTLDTWCCHLSCGRRCLLLATDPTSSLRWRPLSEEAVFAGTLWLTGWVTRSDSHSHFNFET